MIDGRGRFAGGCSANIMEEVLLPVAPPSEKSPFRSPCMEVECSVVGVVPLSS